MFKQDYFKWVGLLTPCESLITDIKGKEENSSEVLVLVGLDIFSFGIINPQLHEEHYVY